MKKIHTPLMIQHGGADLRVPLSQGSEFYHAIKRQGKEVEFILYPYMSHGPYLPHIQIDVMRRNIDWFEKLLD